MDEERFAQGKMISQTCPLAPTLTQFLRFNFLLMMLLTMLSHTTKKESTSTRCMQTHSDRNRAIINRAPLKCYCEWGRGVLRKRTMPTRKNSRSHYSPPFSYLLLSLFVHSCLVVGHRKHKGVANCGRGAVQSCQWRENAGFAQSH